MRILIYILIFFLLFAGYFHPISSITQDLGRHLATGDIIIQTGEVPKVNLYSYTYPNFPFINHHWLSEVTYSSLFKITGFNGLLILNTLLILFSFALLFFSISRKAHPIALAITSILSIQILFERTDVRPELFSFLFFSVFIFLLYFFRKKPTLWILGLIPLEIIWTNMHIYFPTGIILVGIFLIDSVIHNAKRVFNKTSILLAITFVGTSIATIINPNFIDGALYPLRVFQNYGYSIQENQNIFFLWGLFHTPTITYLYIAVAILTACLLINFKATQIKDWLLTAAFGILAAMSIRNLPLFAFATYIPFTIYLSNIFKKNPNFKHIFLHVIIIILLIFQIIQVSSRKPIGLGVEAGATPAADFFIENGLKGPIFNNFDIGSYLDYRLYPKEKVFVDGRPEAYPSNFFKDEYIPMQNDSLMFEKMDKKYSFNTIFFSHTDQTPWGEKFIQQIMQNPKWNLVYLDNFTAILAKDKNIKPVIKTNYSDIKSLTQLAHFFQNTKLQDEKIKIYQAILSINPSSCPALYNLILQLQEKNDPSFPIFANRFQQNCQ
ncbi:MAG: hypothetical protein Q8P26_01120 [Candidatus Levybacteria bacterium]|nr:hypothetical protein [Candidatus Levybacteria bacterium]